MQPAWRAVLPPVRREGITPTKPNAQTDTSAEGETVGRQQPQRRPKRETLLLGHYQITSALQQRVRVLGQQAAVCSRYKNYPCEAPSPAMKA